MKRMTIMMIMIKTVIILNTIKWIIIVIIIVAIKGVPLIMIIDVTLKQL